MGLRQAQTDNCYRIYSWLHNVMLSLACPELAEGKRFRLKIKVAVREGLLPFDKLMTGLFSLTTKGKKITFSNSLFFPYF